MEDKWRKQMQQKLEGHERPLPDLSWDEIDNALAANRRQAGLFSVPQRGMYVWRRRLAAAAAISLIIIGGAVYYSKSGLEDGEGHKLAAAQTGDVNSKAETNFGNKDIKTALARPVTFRNRHIQQKETAIKQMVEEKAIDNDGKTITGENIQEPSVIEKKEETLPGKPQPKDKRQDIYKSLDQTHPAGRPEGSSRLLAAVYTQNAFSRTSDGMGGMTYLPYGDANFEFSNGTNSILENNAPKSVTYDHDHPIKVGVGIRYRINKRWSLATGLTYSYLHSIYEASEKGNSWTGKQNLHYVGLPLVVSYNVFSANRFNIYVTAGGEMQRLVSGRSSDNDFNLSETVKEGRMQWSLNAAIGAQYNFTKNIGMYVEPGVVHYIDNGSSIENYYKYKPTNFNLNLGVRLDL